MTWTTTPISAQRARVMLEDVSRSKGPVPYELALFGLTRSGADNSHRVLSAAYLNLYDQVLDTPGGESHS